MHPNLAIALVLLLCVLVSGCTSDLADELLATPTPLYTTQPTPFPPRSHDLPVALDNGNASPDHRARPDITCPTAGEPGADQGPPHFGDLPAVPGRPGRDLINRVMMRVYTSDTQYMEYIMSNGAKPIPGDEIVVAGTRSGDRGEVFVISSGIRCKVMDERIFGGMYYEQGLSLFYFLKHCPDLHKLNRAIILSRFYLKIVYRKINVQ